ncbi:MAG: hypothetical protein KDI33_10175 [Halioglobus sp.]|nr:hypothetical protein [Halioglobus sp.]
MNTKNREGRVTKRIAMIVGSLLALVLVLLVGAAIWLKVSIGDFLTPPPDPAGQPSIASYADTAPPPALQGEPAQAPAFSWEAITSPPKSARPWTRWWWPGGAVDAATVDAQLVLLDQSGFGGVEIQPFVSGLIPVEDPAIWERIYSFDTPAYYDILRAGIATADRLGLQVDLTHFSGWPPGGPEVNLQDSLTILAYAEMVLSGSNGKALTVPLPRPTPGLGEYMFGMTEFSGADFTNFAADHARLLSVTAAKRLAGEHAWNPYNVDDTVTLDPDSVQVVTQYMQDGVLHWAPPEGDWTIIASYLLPSGEAPMGAAQKPQGFVVDHLRKPQVIGHYEYAFGERTGLPTLYGKGLRGFFNDSLEFRLRRMSVEDILPEFQARRGYDLAPYLPAVYIEGVDNFYVRELLGVHAAPEFQITPLDDRIRHDYQLTLSDLMIERFVETSANWAQARGLASRGQSYGMDLDIIRALGANTIPETEQLWAGGSDAGLKFASSAAALYGRPLVSAESFVWINRDYAPAARRLKIAADKLFLNGINHIVYHGTPYPFRGGDPSPFGEEGWAPFTGRDNPAHFSSNVSPGNSALWPDVPDLNSYIARSQNLLRQGSPAVDVLIYYPFLGFHGFSGGEGSIETLLEGGLPDADPPGVASENALLQSGREMLGKLVSMPPHEQDARVAWVNAVQPLLQELDRNGISWGWVNDHALQSGKLADGRLTASGGSYAAIVLPNIEAIERDTLSTLQRMAQGGTPIFLSGEQPYRQPGFKDAANGDAAVRAGVTALLASGARELDMMPQAWREALAELPQEPVRYQHSSAIKRYRRLLADGSEIHFLANQSAQDEALQLQLHLAADTPLWWFDALSGAAWPVDAAEGQLELTLSGFESRFLVLGVPLPTGLSAQRADAELVRAGEQRWPLQDWQLTVEDFNASKFALTDWREVDALRHASGPGRYQHGFTLAQKKPGARYLLDLGLVQGSALVRVNGVAVGRASLPPFVVDITASLKSGDNVIEVEVLAPLRNDFVGRALAGDPRYGNMEVYRDELVAAGLMGPVALVEVR